MAHVTRSCCICGKDLTDAASLQHGVGPQCRHKANHVLAKGIPCDLAASKALAQTLAGLSLHLPEEAQPTAVKVIASVVDAVSATGNDFRKVCHQIAWLLSFGPSPEWVTCALSLVAALGYPAMAGLLSGEASTGEARVFFDAEQGRVAFEGPRNKKGQAAIKALGGRWAPGAGADKGYWWVKASACEAFIVALTPYWPCLTGEEAAREAAALWIEEHPASTPAPASAPKSSPVQLSEKGGWLKIVSPYNMGFVAGVKALPWNDRQWDATRKAWFVKSEHKAEVLALCEKHYNAPAPVVLAA